MRIRKHSVPSDITTIREVSEQHRKFMMPSHPHHTLLEKNDHRGKQKVEDPIVPRYIRGRGWRDLLTSLNSYHHHSIHQVTSAKKNGRSTSDMAFSSEKNGSKRSPKDEEAPMKVKGRKVKSEEEEEKTRATKSRRAKAKIVEAKDRLGFNGVQKSSDDIHHDDEVSERKTKKRKSLKTLHGVLDHQSFVSPRYSFALS